MNELSHRFITKKSIEIAGIKLRAEQKHKLIESSTLPDIDEKDNLFAAHFYNPVTQLNFRSERETALTRFIEHYDKSKNGENLEEIGRAVHYLEDLNTPVHVAYEDKFDSVYRLSGHIEFENTCDSLIDEVKDIVFEIDKKYYIVNPLETIGKAGAMTASVLYDEYENCYEQHIPEVGRKALLNAIKATAGILYRVFGGAANVQSK